MALISLYITMIKACKIWSARGLLDMKETKPRAVSYNDSIVGYAVES